jgi:hypothetical protein
MDEVEQLVHPYATDSDRQKIIILFIAALSILSAWLFSQSLLWLNFDAPWWLDTPAVLGFFGIYWKLYDQYFWAIAVSGKTISGIPNFSGRWVGKLTTSHDPDLPVALKATITQTSTRIYIAQSANDTSESHSVMAAVLCNVGPFEGLTYLYENRPKGIHKAGALNAHRGEARLRLQDDGSLQGDYSTDQARKNVGSIDLYRAS